MTIATKLSEGTVYVAGDRFVCASTRCAGMTAVFSGRDIDGRKLRAVDARDVAEWATYDLGALTCECGSVTAGEVAWMYGLVDGGAEGWWLADEGLAPTRVSQAQVDVLAGLEEGWDAGSADVRYAGAVGDLLVNLADGRWIELGEDGSTEDVTTEVMG